MNQNSSAKDDPGWDGSLSESSHLDDDDLFADDLDYGLPSEDHDGPSWGLIIGALVAVVAIGFLVFDGLNAETYFFDVDVAVERGDDLIGETIRVRGTVEPGSYAGSDGNINNRFRISEQGVSMTVVYHRALPDTFQEESEIVAQGRLDEDFVLHADEVLVKCPSRYEGAPPEASDTDVSEPQASR